MSFELLKPAIAALKILALQRVGLWFLPSKLQALKAQSTPTLQFQGV
jgi:hypothetical protein